MATAKRKVKSERVKERIRQYKHNFRMMQRTRREGECWVWTGATVTDKWGMYEYGHTQSGGKRMTAHRAMWKSCKGSLPSSGQLVNLCGNTLCVNPEHWVWCKHWTALRTRR
jgi:hypothetical protein